VTEPSAYQGFKLIVDGFSPADRNTRHILIGAGFALAAAGLSLMRRRRPTFAAAFSVALVLGVAMELADAYDDLRSLGFWRVGASLADIARTILVPAIAFALAAAWRSRRA
jgi:hypothetical protein